MSSTEAVVQGGEERPRRPAAVVVIGVLMLCLGSLGTVWGVVSLLMLGFGDLGEWAPPGTLPLQTLSTVQSLAWVVACVGLLFLREWARVACLVLASISIARLAIMLAGAAVGLSRSAESDSAQLAEAMEPGVQSMPIPLYGYVIWFAGIVFFACMIYFLTRPTVKAAFRPMPKADLEAPAA
jgi:hypothetical protein